jgi:hypothetical protein|tara:strand:+ start:6663 stop:7133 length:471 start_codon:yes stop_codon:yes gene_type:complete
LIFTKRRYDLGKKLSKTTNLVKLSVGTEIVQDLAKWQATPRAQTKDGLPRHVTRMWPKRGEELLNGGSIYWVIKGKILCRQIILRLDETIGNDGIRRCAIVCDPKLINVASTPKRAFQGWRYLQLSDAPPDLAPARPNDDALPPELQTALADIGLL